ncbi:hypothetical protein L208DRAFT_1381020 [Tricholoma matsutake]|nr:hypothetical protein L208DRAFT_1381020 [Tricholoma matsutake 945]
MSICPTSHIILTFPQAITAVPTATFPINKQAVVPPSPPPPPTVTLSACCFPDPNLAPPQSITTAPPTASSGPSNKTSHSSPPTATQSAHHSSDPIQTPPFITAVPIQLPPTSMGNMWNHMPIAPSTTTMTPHGQSGLELILQTGQALPAGLQFIDHSEMHLPHHCPLPSSHLLVTPHPPFPPLSMIPPAIYVLSSLSGFLADHGIPTSLLLAATNSLVVVFVVGHSDHCCGSSPTIMAPGLPSPFLNVLLVRGGRKKHAPSLSQTHLLAYPILQLSSIATNPKKSDSHISDICTPAALHGGGGTYGERAQIWTLQFWVGGVYGAGSHCEHDDGDMGKWGGETGTGMAYQWMTNFPTIISSKREVAILTSKGKERGGRLSSICT